MVHLIRRQSETHFCTKRNQQREITSNYVPYASPSLQWMRKYFWAIKHDLPNCFVWTENTSQVCACQSVRNVNCVDFSLHFTRSVSNVEMQFATRAAGHSVRVALSGENVEFNSPLASNAESLSLEHNINWLIIMWHMIIWYLCISWFGSSDTEDTRTLLDCLLRNTGLVFLFLFRAQFWQKS